MTLGERIKEHRQNAKLSQEKVAELVGVSRQAVTKWESNQSLPSTENLFKLAEILGTTVDLLIPSEINKEEKLAEQIYHLQIQEREKRAQEFRVKCKKNILMTFLIIAGYLAVYLIGRLICGDFKNSTFIGWLFGTDSKYYLYGWLLSSKLFWVSMTISALPSLFGKYRFSFITFVTFMLGIFIGEWLGPNPEGAFYGNTHYGWAIGGGMFLGAIVIGIVWEIIFKIHKNKVSST